MPKGVDEAVWKRAKAAVKPGPDDSESSYHANVMMVYKRMMGESKKAVIHCFFSPIAKGMTKRELERFEDDEREGAEEYEREAEEAEDEGADDETEDAFEEMADDEKEHLKKIGKLKKKRSAVEQAKRTIEGED